MSKSDMLCFLIRGHSVCGTNLLTFGAITFQLTAQPWSASRSLFKPDQSKQCQSAAMTSLFNQTWMKSLCTWEKGAGGNVGGCISSQQFLMEAEEVLHTFLSLFKTEMELTSQHVLAGKVKTVLIKFLTYKQSWPRAEKRFFELSHWFLKQSSGKSKIILSLSASHVEAQRIEWSRASSDAIIPEWISGIPERGEKKKKKKELSPRK